MYLSILTLCLLAGFFSSALAILDIKTKDFHEDMHSFDVSTRKLEDTCELDFVDCLVDGGIIVGCGSLLEKGDANKWCVDSEDNSEFCCGDDCCKVKRSVIAGAIVGGVVLLLLLILCSCACCTGCPFHDKLCCATPKPDTAPLTSTAAQAAIVVAPKKTKDEKAYGYKANADRDNGRCEA